MFRIELRDLRLTARGIAATLSLTLPVAVTTGSACALFLWLLDGATQLRFSHGWLLWLLPLSGALVAWLYERFGSSADSGNNLLIDAIHDAPTDALTAVAANEAANEKDAVEPKIGASQAESQGNSLVPRRMAPLILGATLLTHLCGGSAGREGTAVQMGGALGAAWARALRLSRAQTRIVLMCGIAAGFGGVFGTPLAGAVFALEVLTVGGLWRGAARFESSNSDASIDAALACLLAALLGDWVTQAWGVHHLAYAVTSSAAASNHGAFDAVLAFKIALAAAAFGLAATLFAETTHVLSDFFKARLSSPILRPIVGGCLIIALTWGLGTRDYLGLGISSPDLNAVTLSSAFHAGGATPFSWWWKLVFTALTLGSGFKGGEVTPLFFVGATLGNTLAGPLHAPVDVLAAMGFIGIFAGATNTPLASTLMGIELFGSAMAPYAAISCFLSCAWSGESGIYLSQRLAAAKSGTTLREARENRAKSIDSS